MKKVIKKLHELKTSNNQHYFTCKIVLYPYQLQLTGAELCQSSITKKINGTYTNLILILSCFLEKFKAPLNNPQNRKRS